MNRHETTLLKLSALAETMLKHVKDAEREADYGIPTFGPTPSEEWGEQLSLLHEPIADLFQAVSGKAGHASDCSTCDAPAFMPGPCDCDFIAQGQAS
jgi:hypothetical protein